jgi:hypothetical protein
VAFVLIPSSLLGPATWQQVADALLAAGHSATVVRVEDVAAVSTTEDLVLVPHSNAGYGTPRLAQEIGAVGTVFVDAALPPVDATETALAPPQHLAFLESLAGEDGLLPPWTQWWDDLGDLFPSAEVRARVEAEQSRLPLSYFHQRIPVPSGWARRPCAYLAFGSTYAEELAFAREQGWPVSEIDGGHLHQLHDPEGVAGAVAGLAQVLA